MEPLDSERRVVAAAEQLASALGDDPNHTVAAAAMDTTGRIHTAVNVYHFTGGPCAELVVLGVAAATQAGPLLTMAAVGDGPRGLIPPCGRCRQVMLDIQPDILVAVPEAGQPVMYPIRHLLPATFYHPDSDARRVLRFNKRYFDAVSRGEKTVTVRWKEQVDVGPAMFVFEDHPDNPVIDGEALSVERHRLDTLSAHQAGMPESSDVGVFSSRVRNHYPDMPDDAEVDVVRFTITPRPASSGT